MSRWAIVPVKDAACAKRRLGGALGPLREQFARELALRTLDVIRRSRLFEGLIVVTSDACVRAACDLPGVTVLPDPGDGLNAACSRALLAATSAGAAQAWIMHSDLATVDACTLRDLAVQYRDRGARVGADAVGLVRCKDGTGTNAVLLDPRAPFVPQFGPGSFSLHLRQAGARACELQAGEAAYDIDTAQDLERLFGIAPMAGWLKRYAGARQGAPVGAAWSAYGPDRRPEGEDVGLAVSQ